MATRCCWMTPGSNGSWGRSWLCRRYGGCESTPGCRLYCRRGSPPASSKSSTSVVVHANHPAELDAAVAGALADLAGAGVLLFNQSVLLSGVNDSVETLAALSERLLDLRVVPYYLHAPDRVRGTAHFDVPDQTAIGLHAGLKAVLPGYAVPRLVREVPGEVSKVWIG